MSHPRDERGSIAPLVPILLLAFLLMGGLVIDGIRALNARSNAQAIAEEAARVGATGIDKTQADLQLDPAMVQQRYSAYCLALKSFTAAGSPTCVGGPAQITSSIGCNNVQVPLIVQAKVKETIRTTLLGLVGPSSFSFTEAAIASPFQGLNAQKLCGGQNP